MGVVKGVGFDEFPKQGEYLGGRVKVAFRFDLRKARQLEGTVVRDDVDGPGVMIIRLDDGRYVLSTECQWS